MVSLSQIDPDADTSAYASILNVIDDPEVTGSLTNWDLAYLEGLYQSERRDANRRANRTEVTASIRRAHQRIQQDRDEAAED